MPKVQDFLPGGKGYSQSPSPEVKKVNRLFDLLSDRRFPWFYPLNMSPVHISSKKIPPKKYFCFTFDIEERYPDGDTTEVATLLQKLRQILDKQSVKATFFVQGNLINILAKELRILAKNGHEIGVHGYRHNHWGNSVWFWQSPPLSLSEKRDDLAATLKFFSQNHLPRPHSFRAPNLNINQNTMDLLADFGFIIDSSFPSFRRPGEGIKKTGSGLWEIPISNLPKPRVVWKKFLPVFDFQPFNLQNLLTISDHYLESYLDRIAASQQREKIYFVFLAHPWEFSANPRFAYCSPNNLRTIDNLIIRLKKRNQTEFVTLFELKEKIAKDG